MNRKWVITLKILGGTSEQWACIPLNNTDTHFKLFVAIVLISYNKFFDTLRHSMLSIHANWNSSILISIKNFAFVVRNSTKKILPLEPNTTFVAGDLIRFPLVYIRPDLERNAVELPKTYCDYFNELKYNYTV